MFEDRTAAGKLLAKALEPYAKDSIVLALPRGGVVLGFEVAQQLGIPLDILVPRKIGHPLHPEYAIGAVDESGAELLNDAEISTVDKTWLREEIERERKEALRRLGTYRGDKPKLSLTGKTAILIDDGIATGLTMRLALASVRKKGAQRIIVAVPVAPEESVHALKKDGADEIIVLEPPGTFFGAVGAHYEYFPQT